MIRVWRAEDTRAVAEIERVSFPDTWSEEMLEESLENPAFSGFVSEENGEVTGYVGLLCVYDAEIALIAVRPQNRRSGVGGALLAEALKYARSKGCKNVFLEVRTGNAPARAMYEKAGFVPVYVRKNYYGEGQDALVMVNSVP